MPRSGDELRFSQSACVYLAASTPSMSISIDLERAHLTGNVRTFFAPDVPAVREFVPGFEAKVWHGVMALAGTSERIINKLNEEIVAFLPQPSTDAKLRERGVIKQAGIKAE